MIWMEGQIVPDSALWISALDRTLEHGLGLFETLRTWDGYPVLLDRHIERMERSARELGLAIEEIRLPKPRDVVALIAADGHPGDAMIRITLTGGPSPAEAGRLWMRAAPLPPTIAAARLGDAWSVDENDPLARHKSLNYWRRRMAYERATAEGFDEALSRTPDRSYWEGSRTNLFVVDDRGRLVTPPVDGPIVPGILRALVLERARALAIETIETRVSNDSLERAGEVFLTNSVRGMIPVGRWMEIAYPAPGALTQRVWSATHEWLIRRGAESGEPAQ